KIGQRTKPFALHEFLFALASNHPEIAKVASDQQRGVVLQLAHPAREPACSFRTVHSQVYVAGEVAGHNRSVLSSAAGEVREVPGSARAMSPWPPMTPGREPSRAAGRSAPGSSGSRSGALRQSG